MILIKKDEKKIGTIKLINSFAWKVKNNQHIKRKISTDRLGVFERTPSVNNGARVRCSHLDKFCCGNFLPHQNWRALVIFIMKKGLNYFVFLNLDLVTLYSTPSILMLSKKSWKICPGFIVSTSMFVTLFKIFCFNLGS